MNRWPLHFVHCASLANEFPALLMPSFILIRGLYPSHRLALSIRNVLVIVLNSIPPLVILDFLRPNEAIQTIHSAFVAIVSPTTLGITRISSTFDRYPAEVGGG